MDTSTCCHDCKDTRFGSFFSIIQFFYKPCYFQIMVLYFVTFLTKLIKTMPNVNIYLKKFKLQLAVQTYKYLL